MDDGEVLSGGWWNFNSWRGFGERLRGEKGEGQGRDSLAELGSGCAVPGIDFVEGFQQGAFCCGDAQEVEAGVGDCSGAVGEAD